LLPHYRFSSLSRVQAPYQDFFLKTPWTTDWLTFDNS
jgi:hypothetical protein